MTRALALHASDNKDFGAGLIAAAVVFGAIKLANDSPQARRGVTQYQIDQLKAEIARVEEQLVQVKAHVFAVLDEETALFFAAGVYGVGQAIRAWTETGDTVAAKGALAQVETMEYRFVQTLGNPPDFMSDEVVVMLGKLYIRHTSFRLTIHALNGLENWSDAEAAALKAAAPKVSKSVLAAQQRLRAADYSMCLGERDSTWEPPVGAGEPGTVRASQTYGLSHLGAECEILDTARWSDYAIAPRELEIRLARAEARAMTTARDVVTAEITKRSTAEAQNDLLEELTFLEKMLGAEE